jgi:hypothetical protein
MTTITENIGIEVSYIDFIEDGSWPHHLYEVELTYQGRNFTTTYSMGLAHTSEPEIKDVVYSLISDSNTIEFSDGKFESWCADLGYNPDSIKDKKVFDDCVINYKGFQFMIGDDYPKLVKEYEEY